MLEWILTRFWVKQFEIKFQFSDNATIPLILCSKYMNKRLKSWNALNHFITCSKPSLSSHIWMKGEEHLGANTDSWHVRLKHLYKIYRLQGLNNYYTLQTLQGWSIADCYCKSIEKLIKKNLTNNVKYFYYNIISHTTEWHSTSAAATNGNKKIITDHFMANLATLAQEVECS